MWSLFKKKEGEECFLDNFSGDKLAPLKFSNQKTQADIVKEVLESIEKGNKLILIKGVCGTGKSAIALNLARHFKKTSIVVPIKSLQEQYEQDYTKKNYILKKDNSPLRISVIKGRNNFQCKFIQSDKADSKFLPCTVELKESNLQQIKEFLSQNPLSPQFSSVKDIRRTMLASVCPHWSPLLPSDVTPKYLDDARKLKYPAVSGKEYALFQRQPGCKYYEQYKAYIDSDVLIFNSLKYLIETAIGRKPKTDLDIIDECDDFLDNFAQEEKVNLGRLSFALTTIFPENQEKRLKLREINEKLNSILYDYDLKEIAKIGSTDIIDLVDLVLENSDLAEDEEDNYYNRVVETFSIFSHLLDETYVSMEKETKDGKQSSYLTLVTINLAERFRAILNSTSALVMMSGTLHSSQVLKDIFGIENFKIIEAEVNLPGIISKIRTGLEQNCKYENLKSGLVTREKYLKALEACIKQAKPPILVHVNSFEDLPTELEKAMYRLEKLITREKLKEMHQQKHITSFKNKEADILFTTKCSRGVDFPGDICNSIILTRYPYPNISSPFWKILKQEYPEKFLEFYLDKAKRDLIQKIARGLRFKGDHVLLLSPDVRVLNDSLR